MKYVKFFLLAFLSVSLFSCKESVPKDILKLDPKNMQVRKLQTRMFETQDEKKLLSSSAAVLQDMGFTLDESETKLGVIVASKDRKTENSRAAGIALNTLALIAKAAIGSGSYDSPTKGVDDKQKIRVSLITRDSKQEQFSVRVTFQRLVWDMDGELTRLETMRDEKLYSDFFQQLSKSVFLEAHTV